MSDGTPAYASAFTLLKNLNQEPAFSRLWRCIDGPLHYPPEASSHDLAGEVSVQIHVNTQGQLRRIDESSWRGHRLFQSWIAEVLTTALAQDCLRHPLPAETQLNLSFYFQIEQDASLFVDHPRVIGQSLHFDLKAIRPAPLDIGQPLVVAQRIRQMISGEAPQKESFFERLERFEKACELQAEGGCYQAALMKRQLGEVQACRSLMKRACELGFTEKCGEPCSE